MQFVSYMTLLYYYTETKEIIYESLLNLKGAVINQLHHLNQS